MMIVLHVHPFIELTQAYNNVRSFFQPFLLTQTLIATLSKSKTMSKVIAERLADSKSTKRQIEESREGYRPVAVRGSLLYFIVAELCRVDVMYQYSLDYFQVQYVARVPALIWKVESSACPPDDCHDNKYLPFEELSPVRCSERGGGLLVFCMPWLVGH